MLSDTTPPKIMPTTPITALNWLRDALFARVAVRLGAGQTEYATTHIWPTSRGKVRLSAGPDWSCYLQFALPSESWEVYSNAIKMHAYDAREQRSFESEVELSQALDDYVEKILAMAKD